MRHHNLATWFLLLTLIVTYLLHANPFDLWMPDMIAMGLTSLFCVALFAYTSLFWKEAPRDERELEHSRIADRYAYIAANVALIVAISVSMIRHADDFWLVTIALVMSTVKILSQYLLNRHD